MVKKIQSRPAVHDERTKPRTPVKVGLILECSNNGPDQQVCTYLINWLEPTIEVVNRPLQNKKNLLAKCGDVAALLLKDGCKRVIIVWDLFPPPHDTTQKPCRYQD